MTLPLLSMEPTGDDIPLHFARAWAESTIRLLHETRTNRTTLRELEAGSSEYDQASDPHLQTAVRTTWTSECLLVLSASQLENWIRVLFRSRGRKVPQPLAGLTNLRNAIEHLHEATLEESTFVAKPRGARARKRGVGALPGGELPLYAADEEKLFGVLTSDELDRLARDLLHELGREQSQYVQDLMAWFHLQQDGDS